MTLKFQKLYQKTKNNNMKKINVAELLKNCSTDMELDSPMYDNLYFGRVEEDHGLLILCYTIYHGNKTAVYFTEFGSYNTHKTAKCVIFPKGKTTWEGFVSPFKFKDGDILFVEALYDWIFIYKENKNKEDLYKYVAIPTDASHNYIVYDNNPLCCRKDTSKIRFATEEEIEKLFKAIKDSGFKWNAKTKNLEGLIEPKFKVGDKVRHKNNHGVVFTITNIEEDSYICGVATAFWFEDQDNYELVPNKFDIHTLTPLEPVLVRNTNGQVWTMDFFSHIIDTNKGLKPSVVCVGHCPNQCIPYKGNEFLRGTADKCKDFYKTWES